MQAIHPFPARMAPEAITDWLTSLPQGSRVLDPMCGSGVVLRHSVEMGHKALGYDLDPLAVLMSRVWTRSGRHTSLSEYAREVVVAAKVGKTSHKSLPWIAACDETRAFVEYWFGEPQLTAISSLVSAIGSTMTDRADWVVDALNIALSRIIVTKQAGASLSWDASHSRPHRKITYNDFDVFSGFLRSVDRMITILDGSPIRRSAYVRDGDCRSLSGVGNESVDAVITSPPYLNAIDYLRGHKLSLVWMGHTIPSLRSIRASAIGTERAGRDTVTGELERAFPTLKQLPGRQRAIVQKYANDAGGMLREIRRVIKPSGRVVLVVADSCVRGIEISNSQIFSTIASQNGLALHSAKSRELPPNRRYLPINTKDVSLSRRMKQEIVQVYLPFA